MRIARDLKEARVAPLEVEEIRLSGQGLNALDEDMPFMPNLRVLDLSDNNLRTLPSWIWKQANLEQFSFKANQIDLVPSAIAQLTKLKRLVADRNPIAGFNKLPLRLNELYANHCPINSFPEELLNCPSILVIELAGCHLRELDSLPSLPMALASIDLRNNRILKFPFSIFRTAELEVVKLDGNPLFKYLRKEVDAKLIARIFADTYGNGWDLDRRNCALDVVLENMESVGEWSQKDLLDVATCEFGYLRDHAMASLPKFWKSPFNTEHTFRLAVEGKLPSVRRVDLEVALKNKGCQWLEDVSGPEDILIIGQGAKRARGREALAKGVKVGLEGHVVEWLRQGQGSSLVSADLKNPLVANLTTLLTSDNAFNVEMALQIMKGTGVPRVLRGTLLALRMLHRDAEIRRLVEPALMELADAPFRKLLGSTIKECFHKDDYVNFQGVVERLGGRIGADLFPFLKMAWVQHGLGKGWIADLPPLEQAAMLDLLERFGGLDLSGTGFSHAPEGLWTDRKVVSLNLARNMLQSLDGRIGRFHDLQTLDLSENLLQDLPEELFDLVNLASLDLSTNALTHLRGRWENLQSLVALKLGGNPLESIPASLGRLQSLELLGLRKVKPDLAIRALPYFAQIKDLDLGECGMTEAPIALRDFDQLESLSIDLNPIHNLPDWLGELPKLRRLDIGNLRITRLPEGLAVAPKLEWIQMEQNESMDWEQVAGVLAQVPTLRNVVFPENIIPSVKRMLENRIKAMVSYSHGYDLPF